MRTLIRSGFWTFVAFIVAIGAVHAELRIATYNLDNYLVMDRHVNNRWRPAYPKPENEKVIVRQTILQTDPDILALQEMGSLDFLEELRADLAGQGMHYSYAVHMQGEDSDRHLALLSKIPPRSVVKHTDLDFKYMDRRERVKRGMLEASFEDAEGKLFKVFLVHLKSKWTDEPKDPESKLRRVREAEACRNRIIERTHELGLTNYLVLGDFNDHPRSSTMRRFYRRGDKEIGSLVPASDSRGDVWTYYYEKEASYARVDNIVVSNQLAPQIKTGQARIVDMPGAMVGSDHRMVYLDLGLGIQTAVQDAEANSTKAN